MQITLFQTLAQLSRRGSSLKKQREYKLWLAFEPQSSVNFQCDAFSVETIHH
jgi:hypothetical protein